MSKRVYLAFFILELGVLLVFSRFSPFPGTMDADYYQAGGMQLAKGDGFSVPFLWNYLDDPAGLPHPSHTYWMPLTSLLVWVGMILSGSLDFEKSRIIFILLSCLLPPLTASLGYRLSKSKYVALLAGAFSVFSGFYFPFLATSDSFPLYWLFGIWIFYALPESGEEIRKGKIIVLGMVVGLMHLTRSDGLFWFALAFLWLLFFNRFGSSAKERFTALFRGWGLLVFGYLIVMGPWMARNFLVFGSPFNPHLSRSLWIIDYNEMFLFPADGLTFQHWLSQGWQSILHARWWAAGINLQRALAEQSLIFLVPFILAGWYALRKDQRVMFFASAWGMTFFAMSFLFPFAGARGGFFHACAAIQPVIFVLAAVGIDRFVRWGVRKRGWQDSQAHVVFGATFVFFALAITGFVSVRQVYDLKTHENVWGKTERAYRAIDRRLVSLGASKHDVVMVNNPPGYSLMTGRKSIVVPDGGIGSLMQAAESFGADYLILDKNIPEELTGLYNHSETHSKIHLLESFQDFNIYRIEIGNDD